MAFAYVYYVVDKMQAKVPAGYIKNYGTEKSSTEGVQKVFWSRYIHSLQKDPASLDKLKSMREPPAKHLWNTVEGERYYKAFILRIEDSLDALIKSINDKRPILPYIPNENALSSSTEDEVVNARLERINKKQEESVIKKKEQAAKRSRAKEILKNAKKARTEEFAELDIRNGSDSNEHESDSDEDPELIPRRDFTELKKSFDMLENEKEKTEKKLEITEKDFFALQKKYEDLKEEFNEVIELRALNRKLQERFLEITQRGCFHIEAGIQREAQTSSDCETDEVDLGAGIVIKKKVYQEVMALDHVRKVTKSLAVAIWGSTVLAGRSVKGKPCKNRNGPKKVPAGDLQMALVPQQETKPPLTPDKLAVISNQMRDYLLKRGKDATEVETELKNRNRYISDKIQDICTSVARAEAKKKSL